MHQTTLRFPETLWRALEIEAERLGVSVAQYVREAALARAAYEAGRRGEPLFIDLSILSSARSEAPERGAMERADDAVSTSSAVWAQAQVTRRRSEALREHARTRRQLPA